MLVGVSVLKVMKLPPLGEIPLKGDYQFIEMRRHFRRESLILAHAVDAPPAQPLPAARAFYWVEGESPHLSTAFAHRVFDAYWMQDAPIERPEVLGGIYSDLGGSADGLIRALEDDEAGKLLRSAITRSIARGVFGSPFFLIDGEPFFGYDKLAHIEEWLSVGGW